MKRVLLLLVALVFFVAPLSVQAQKDSLRTSLIEGAKALQFGVATNFTLGAFNGSTFSGKWQLSDRRALRVGFDISGRITNSETTTTREAVSSLGDENTELTEANNDELDFFIRLNAYYMAYPNPGGRMNFYTGIGPTLTYSVGNQEIGATTSSSGSPQTVLADETSDDSRVGVGLGFILGVEWFINRRLSLTSEYGISAFYSVFSEESDSISTLTTNESIRATHVDRSDDQFFVSGNGVRFGMSVYF